MKGPFLFYLTAIFLITNFFLVESLTIFNEISSENHPRFQNRSSPDWFGTGVAFGETLSTINFTKGDSFKGKICGLFIDPKNEVLYASSTGGFFHSINMKTGKELNAIKTLPGSCAIAYNQNHFYVINEFANSISIIDESDYSEVSTIKLKLPYEMVANSNNGLLYITSDKSNKVFVMDESGDIKKEFDITDPCGIAIDAKQNLVFVTSEDSSSVHVIDGKTNEVTSIIQVGNGPRGMGVDEKNAKLYVANSISDTISVIDSKSGKVESTIPVIEDPRKVLINPNSNTLYLLGGASNTVAIIDLATHEIRNSITLLNPWGISINPETNTIYVTNLSNQILVIQEEIEQKQDLDYLLIGTIIAIISGIMIFFAIKFRKQKSPLSNKNL